MLLNCAVVVLLLTTANSAPSTCAPGFVRFPSGNMCIMRHWLCDGEDDCGDNSDENPVNCQQYTCAPGRFQCRNSLCVPELRFCDGMNDCGDNSDEPPNCKSTERSVIKTNSISETSEPQTTKETLSQTTARMEITNTPASKTLTTGQLIEGLSGSIEGATDRSITDESRTRSITERVITESSDTSDIKINYSLSGYFAIKGKGLMNMLTKLDGFMENMANKVFKLESRQKVLEEKLSDLAWTNYDLEKEKNVEAGIIF